MGVAWVLHEGKGRWLGVSLLKYLLPFKNSLGVGRRYILITDDLAYPMHSLLPCIKETKLKRNSTEWRRQAEVNAAGCSGAEIPGRFPPPLASKSNLYCFLCSPTSCSSTTFPGGKFRVAGNFIQGQHTLLGAICSGEEMSRMYFCRCLVLGGTW